MEGDNQLMPTSIDNRIVQMEFDNAQFEKNTKQSMSTLEKLKSSLDFSNVPDSFSKITQSANNVDLSAIESGVLALQNRFSAWGIVGMQVISELTSSAIIMGKRLSNITIGQIKAGGMSRASNIQKAQLMLEGLLKTEEGVTDFSKVTDVMNDATDAVNNTAYGLDEAALVASQLAASGVEIKAWSHDLSGGFSKVKEEADPMARSLMAVSGLAAMTSSSYSDIGQIFTTVAGNGKLMGMQLQQLSGRGINAAATMAEQWGKTEAEVRDMVSKGKVTYTMFADAMYDAFASQAYKANRTLTGVMSNTKAALSKIGADIFTPLIQNTATAEGGLVNVVQVVDKVREKLNDFRSAFTKPLGANSDSMDPSKWSEWIKLVNNLSTAARDAIGKIDASKIGSEFFDKTNKALAITNKALPGLWTGLAKISNYISKTTKTISKFISTLGTYFKTTIQNTFSDKSVTKGLDLIIAKLNRLRFYYIPSLTKVFGNLRELVRSFVTNLIKPKNASNIASIFSNLTQSAINFGEALKGKNFKDIAANIGGGLASAFSILLDVFAKLSPILKPIGTLLGGIVDFALDAASNIGAFFISLEQGIDRNSYIQAFFDALSSGFEKLSQIDFHPIELISNTFDKIVSGIKTILSNFIQFIQPLIEQIKTSFTNIKDAIVSPFDGDNKISALDVISTFIKTLAAIKITSLGADLINLFSDLGTSLDSLNKNFKGISAANLETIAKAVALLTGSLFVLASIDGEAIKRSLGAAAVGLGEIVAAFYLLKGRNIKDAKEATKKNGPLQALGDAIGSFSKSKYKSMIEIASALIIFAGALKIISSISGDDLGKGLVALAVALGELYAVLEIMEKFLKDDPTASAKAILKVSLALLPIAIALKLVSSIDISQMGNALLALGVTLAIMGTIITVMSNMQNSAGAAIAAASSILILSLALLPISTALVALTFFDYTALGQSMALLVLTLGIMGTIITVMSNMQKSAGAAISAASSILVVSLSLIPIAAALVLVNASGVDANSVLMLALSLGAIVLALFTTSKYTSGAILSAIAIGVVATSLLAVATSLKMISTIGSDEMGASLLAFVVSLGAVCVALAGLSVVAVGALVSAAALLVVGAALLALGVALKIISSIDVGTLVIDIVALGSALAVLAVSSPALAAAAPGILAAAGSIAAFGAACVVLGAGAAAVGAAMTLIGAGIEGLVSSVVNAVNIIIQGISDIITNIANLIGNVLTILYNVGATIIGAIASALGVASPSTKFAEIGKYCIEGLINGITGAIGLIGATMSRVAKACLNGLKTIVNGAVQAGKNFVNGLVNGITSGIGSIGRAVANLANSALDKLKSTFKSHSPSRATFTIGGHYDKGLANGIAKFGYLVVNSVKNVGDDALSSMTNALSELNMIPDSLNASPVITPVLDLSQVQNGTAALSSMFNSGYTMRAAASVAGSFTSPSQVQSDRLNTAMSAAMKNLIEAQQVEENPTYTFNIPLEVNGRQIAKATRSYNRTELDNLDTILDRKAGIK